MTIINAWYNFIDDLAEHTVEDIIQRVAVGPQEEVIALIEALNRIFNTDFKCTPSFRWQPGFYKKLVEVTGRVSEVTTVKNKVSTYRNKITNGRWQVDRLLEKIGTIDNKLYSLRSNNVSFQDNTDDVNRVLGEYKDKILESTVLAGELYPDYDVQIFHGTHSSGNTRRDLQNRPHIIYYININNVNTSVNIGEESISIPMGGIELIICVDFVKNIYNRIKGTRKYSANHSIGGHTTPYTGARFHSLEADILFPYISSRSWGASKNVSFTEGEHEAIKYEDVCFGHFHEDIIEAAWAGDILALCTYIKSWTSKFNIGTTGPLNSYDRMYHGLWPSMDNDTWKSAGRSTHGLARAEQCSYGREILPNNQPAEDQSYCHRYECVLRDICPSFKEMYRPNPQVAEDEISISEEQMAREQALINILQNRTGR